MFYTSLSSSGDSLFAEVDRLQREVQSLFGGRSAPTSIRSVARGTFPALNVATTPTSIAIYAFAPGLDPASLDVNVDRGVLSIAGQRKKELPEPGGEIAVYAAERFSGSFDRKLALPEDADAANIDARYTEGVLCITLPRKQKEQARRIAIN